jgi:hypothetical protein
MITEDKIIKFKGWDCRVSIQDYAANRHIKCIKLQDAETYEPIATATVYHKGLQDDEIGIKDWSENEGIYIALLRAEIIESKHRIILSGHVVILVCKLKE